MKALCINMDGWNYDRSILWGLIKFKKSIKGPTFGDTVTILNSYYDEGELFYVIKEWPPCDLDSGWQADQFILMSEESYREQLENVNTNKL